MQGSLLVIPFLDLLFTLPQDSTEDTYLLEEFIWLLHWLLFLLQNLDNLFVRILQSCIGTLLILFGSSCSGLFMFGEVGHLQLNWLLVLRGGKQCNLFCMMLVLLHVLMTRAFSKGRPLQYFFFSNLERINLFFFILNLFKKRKFKS